MPPSAALGGLERVLGGKPDKLYQPHAKRPYRANLKEARGMAVSTINVIIICATVIILAELGYRSRRRHEEARRKDRERRETMANSRGRQ